MQTLVEILKAMSDESRLRVLCAVSGRELCACHIADLLQLAPSTVSKHMTILRRAGLVEARKNGRWMHYRLARRPSSADVGEAIRWVRRQAQATARAQKDIACIEKILCCSSSDNGKK